MDTQIEKTKKIINNILNLLYDKLEIYNTAINFYTEIETANLIYEKEFQYSKHLTELEYLRKNNVLKNIDELEYLITKLENGDLKSFHRVIRSSDLINYNSGFIINELLKIIYTEVDIDNILNQNNLASKTQVILDNANGYLPEDYRNKILSGKAIIFGMGRKYYEKDYDKVYGYDPTDLEDEDILEKIIDDIKTHKYNRILIKINEWPKRIKESWHNNYKNVNYFRENIIFEMNKQLSRDYKFIILGAEVEDASYAESSQLLNIIETKNRQVIIYTLSRNWVYKHIRNWNKEGIAIILLNSPRYFYQVELKTLLKNQNNENNYISVITDTNILISKRGDE